MTDFRHALRSIRRAPGLGATVILTVALAIGVNTAIFSVVNAVILRPLPFDHPERLVQVGEKNDALNLPNFGSSVLNYLSWKEQTRTLQLAAIGFVTFALSDSGEPEQLTGNRITPSLMTVLGLSPIIGRGFSADEDKPQAPRVVMIGEGLWKRRFGSDAGIIGRSLTLGGDDYTVVGVAPSPLTLISGGDVWVPLTIDPARDVRLNHVLFTVARLQSGVSIEQAQAEMNAIASRIARQYPEMKDWGVRLTTFHDTFVSTQLQTALLVLLSAVVCVMLIAAANIANLLLSRAAARQKEIAVRTAIGASRGRMLRQLLVESVTLAAIGGAIGVVAAAVALPIVERSLPANLLPVPDIALDRMVLLFAIAMTVATGLLFGVAPSLRSAGANLNALLTLAGRGSGTPATPRLRNTLAAAELALATVLLIGAGLMIQTLAGLQRVPLGFEPQGVLAFQVAPPTARYPLKERAPVFYRSVVDALPTIPGVKAAGISSGIPFGVGNYTQTPMLTTGKSVLPPETAVPIDWRTVSPGFFRTLGIPLGRGRDFTDADGAVPVTIVSQATARKFWGDADPIGRTLHRNGDTVGVTVVGVAGDVHTTALNQDSPALYYPMARGTWPLMDIVVRTDGDPRALISAIRQKVSELDPTLPLANVRTMEEWVTNAAAQPRLNAQLLGLFAALALTIAAIGIYGVLAYSVTQRTREIGLRMALGAPRSGVLGAIVREGMAVSLAGVGVGLVAAFAFSRALESLVFGVRVHDPITFAGVAVVLSVVALLACVLPALRASRVDPIVALRQD
jgi:putative ABC transport system permease protein